MDFLLKFFSACLDSSLTLYSYFCGRARSVMSGWWSRSNRDVLLSDLLFSSKASSFCKGFTSII